MMPSFICLSGFISFIGYNLVSDHFLIGSIVSHAPLKPAGITSESEGYQI